MRTTLNLDDELVLRAKQRAARDRLTLTRVLEDALREYLTPREPAEGYRLNLTVGHLGTRDGVDVDDWDALYDAMDGDP